MESNTSEDQSYLIIKAFAERVAVDRHYIITSEQTEAPADIVDCIISLVQEFELKCQSGGLKFNLYTLVQEKAGDIDISFLTQSYMDVLNGLFTKVNWGRVVAMFAFLKMTINDLIDHSQPLPIEKLVQATSSFVNLHLHDFLCAHCGWRGLLQFNSSADTVSAIAMSGCTLRAIGGVAGIAGIAAVVGFIASSL